MLEAHELYRFFHIGDDETAALRGVSLRLGEGEVVAIMGPSGSGKTTLLSCLTGLDEPDGGHVMVNGERITHRAENARARIRARDFGICLQSGNLFGHLTVRENIELQKALARSDPGNIETLLENVGLQHRADALPAELSGGETARAGLAVALATDPPILIADEPTAEVDAETENKILELFAERRGQGKATLVATHSQALAMHADRIVRLHDGKVSDA